MNLTVVEVSSHHSIKHCGVQPTNTLTTLDESIYERYLHIVRLAFYNQ